MPPAAKQRTAPPGAGGAVAGLALLLASLLAIPSHGQEMARQRAVRWLLEVQGEAGLWSAGTVRECDDTLAAIDALHHATDDEARTAVLRARGALALRAGSQDLTGAISAV